MGIEVAALIDLLNKAGSVGFMVIALVGFYARWWVMGWYARRLEDELDEYKDAAARGTEIAEAYHSRVVATRPRRPRRAGP